MDKACSSSASDRVVQTTEIMAALSSLAIATNYEIGQRLIEEGNFSEYADYFAAVLEVLPHCPTDAPLPHSGR